MKPSTSEASCGLSTTANAQDSDQTGAGDHKPPTPSDNANIFDPEVSMVINAKGTRTTTTSLRQVLADIRSSKYQRCVQKVRDTHSAIGKEVANELKKELPGVLFSGTFFRRATKDLKEHSGVICADIDAKENPALAQAIGPSRAIVAEDPHTLAVFLSPSGTGLKVLCRCDPKRPHIDSFRAAQSHFREKFGLTIDEDCKDVSRLCFVSHDPDLFARDDAKLLPYLTAVTSLSGASRNNANPLDADIGDITHLQAPDETVTLADVPELLGHLDPDMERDKWIRVGMALRHQFPHEPEATKAYGLFDSWSSKAKRLYLGVESTKCLWDSIEPNPIDQKPVTIGTLLKMVDDAVASSWGPIDPLETPAPPTLDLAKAIPSTLANFSSFVVATAQAVQVPVDAVAALAIGVLSAAASRAFEIRLLPQWIEIAVLWIAALGEPGERKSAVLHKLTAPIYGWQVNERHALRKPLAVYAEKRESDKAKLAALRKTLAAVKQPPNAVGLQASADALVQQIESMPELSPPDLISADFTPEAARRLLVANGEKLAFISAETDFQQLTGSRYGGSGQNGGQNLNLMLACKSGDPLPGHRVSKSEPLNRPALSTVIYVQPAAVFDVVRDSNTNGRGLVQRFLFIKPASLMGSRVLTPLPVSSSLEAWWDKTVCDLLDNAWPGRVVLNQGSPVRHMGGPRILDLDTAANSEFNSLRQRVEDRLKEGGDLRPISGFASKLPAEIARIALCLELMQNPKATTVSGPTMTAACHWAEFLIAHHRAILGEAGESAARRNARRLIASLGRNPVAETSARGLFRRIQNTTSMTSMADLQPVLEELISANYLRPIAGSRPKGRGHPSSQRYEVNPAFYVI